MRVFLCHASDDKPAVRRLAQSLRSDGFDPWLDEERLLPGQDWELEISSAVRHADAIVICLSPTSVNKVGYVQKELRKVMDLAEYQPAGRVFAIPVRLEECEVPARLAPYQYADLFSEGGYERLVASLRQLSVPETGGRPLKTRSVTPLLPELKTRRFTWGKAAIAGGLVAIILAALYLWLRPAPAQSDTRVEKPPMKDDGMVAIPGARFLMGRNGWDQASPAHEVIVHPFKIDRTPVTVEQYLAFARASRANLDLNLDQPQSGDLPVTRVTWDDAYAYCSAQNKRLPTEAEFELAARGNDGRLYPWGEQFEPAAVNSQKSGVGRIEAVGSRPLNRSPFGVADLSGNVWQWCVDDYQPYSGGKAGFPIPAGAKVIRGGSYQADARHVAAVIRNLERPQARSPVIGFRCAK